MSFKHLGTALFATLAAASGFAQAIIPVGAGSYASYPPSQANAGSLPTTPPAYLVATNGRPIPSNKWWTDLIEHQYAGNMWAQPLTVSADSQGLNVYNPINWVPSGSNPQMALDGLITIHGQQFSPADARALRWGDWTVSFRMRQSADTFMDVTLGHGLPSVWVEFTGVQPQIAFPSGNAAFFDDNGNAVSFPLTGNHFGVSYSGRYWGIFAPDNTQFTLNNGVVTAGFSGTNAFLVLSAMPVKANLSYFAQYARAVPRDSQMNWTYDPAAGAVTTTWHLDTEILQGTQPQVIQGWLAHHWRNTSNNLAFNGMNYSTPRGLLKCATGTDFQIVYPFNGFPPTLPPPAPTGRANDYVPARMNAYLTSVAANTSVAADTYWGGKDLLRYAQHLAMAHDMGRPEFATLQTTLKSALQNWYTYTPGESTYYFAAYPAWKALVGFQSSYGSEQFNDQHFHYGYFTHASALLGLYDADFLNNYGSMARLVAKDYANWERGDTNFQFFRTFDIWAGHSQASGFPDITRGGNQESSGEAMNSWIGLFLLGASLGDDPMRAAGAMGYVMESAAVREYWFNEHGDVWPPVYNRSVVGILWDNGQDYQTYFGLNPIYIHGIQWLPISPGFMYLAQNPVFAQQQFNNMLSEESASTGANSISSMGSQWGNYALWYALQFNQDYVAAQMDQLSAANDPVATDPIYAGSTYFFTHAYRTLGSLQWQFHLSVPTSAVYYNTNTGQYSYVAFNPLSSGQLATVYSNSLPVGSLFLPARTLVNTHAMDSTNAIPLVVVSTWPAANQTDVTADSSQVTVTFNRGVAAASLAGAAIAGAGVTGLTYAQGDGTTVLSFTINGQLQYAHSYTVTIPASTAVAVGTNTLGADYVFSFTTLASQPVSQNVILNPGFELAGTNTAAATNWTLTQAIGTLVYAVRTNTIPRSGAFHFEVHLATTGSEPVLEFSQAGVPVTGGRVYPFAFYARAASGSAGYAAQWRVFWNAGGDTGYQSFTPGDNAYAFISNSLAAPAAATSATVYFHFSGAADSTKSATIDIDDVSLTLDNSTGGTTSPQTNVVPAQVLAGAQISWPTTAHTNYTIQCATNLGTEAVWTNLAGPLTGDGTTNVFFEPFGSAPLKFYRIRQSP
jgi:endoglucanase Acf2